VNQERKEETPAAPAHSLVMSRVMERLSGSDAVIFTHNQKGDDTIVIQPEDILEVMVMLRDDPDLRFDMMMDLTVADYLGNERVWPYLAGLKARFEVVYHLYSVEKNHRIRVKAPLSLENLYIDSITGVWAGADWFEREAFDLYGVVFRGHPSLKRILLYEGFEGHPLRKDYPKMKRQPLIGPRN